MLLRLSADQSAFSRCSSASWVWSLWGSPGDTEPTPADGRARWARRSTKRRTLSALAEASAEASRCGLLPLLWARRSISASISAPMRALYGEMAIALPSSRRVIARYSG